MALDDLETGGKGRLIERIGELAEAAADCESDACFAGVSLDIVDEIVRFGKYQNWKLCPEQPLPGTLLLQFPVLTLAMVRELERELSCRCLPTRDFCPVKTLGGRLAGKALHSASPKEPSHDQHALPPRGARARHRAMGGEDRRDLRRHRRNHPGDGEKCPHHLA